MGIPLSELLDDDVSSMQEQAKVNNLPDAPFTMRELITPQYRLEFSDSWVSEPSTVAVESGDESWENWVGQHEGERTVLKPTNRKQLVAAVGYKAHNGGHVRAVGSGHSHSDAPAPEGTYIELNPGKPPSELLDDLFDGATPVDLLNRLYEASNPVEILKQFYSGDVPKGVIDALNEPHEDGLNDILEHEGWLKSDDELESIERATKRGEDATGHDYGYDNPLTGRRLKRPAGKTYLKRVQAGLMLRRLNRHVLRHYGEQAYALANMGSFDGQTIAGAVNTSTHGTGVTLSSIADSVRSVEIATVPKSESGNPIVRLYRIEPSNGITDRDAFEADTGTHEMELIQDDDIFHSVVVGYGCMGVVYAYTMRVVDNYWLKEENTLKAWSDVKREMSNSAWELTEDSIKAFLTKDGTRHCQIFLNTAAEQVPEDRINDHESEPGIGPNRDAAHGVGYHEGHRDPLCLIKRHKLSDRPSGTVLRPDTTVSKPLEGWVNATKDQRWPPERRKKPFRDAGKFFLKFHPFSKNHNKANQLHNRFFHPEFRKDQLVGGMDETVWYIGLRRLRDRIGTLSEDEYRHPEPPGPATPTTEIGVQVGDVVEAVDAFRKKVRDVSLVWGTEDNLGDREVFFPAPMGIRFTAASSHFLSPEYGRETAMVELPLPLPGEGKTAGRVKPGVPTLDHNEMRKDVVVPALTQVEQHIREEKQALAPRPHMGKLNSVGFEWLDANYEYFDHYNPSAKAGEVETGWYQNYQRFNAFGTFDNRFTEQLDISMSPSFQSGDFQGTPPATGSRDSSPSNAPEAPSPTPGTPSPDTQKGEATDTPQLDFEITANIEDLEVELPGFGVLAGLAGLGTGAWLRRRFQGSESTDRDAAPTVDSGTSNSNVVNGEAPDKQPGRTEDDSPGED